MPGECIFCQIVKKEMPAEFLYEDEVCVVFRDIHPAAPVHLLIVPRKHIRSVNDLKDEEKDIVSHLFLVARDMAGRSGVRDSGYKLLFNVEKGGGQVIFHLHLHLIGGWKKP